MSYSEVFEELHGKRLLILGGAQWKKDIRRFCDEHGIVIIAAGNDPKSGICQIADEYYNVDSTNSAAMKILIKEKGIQGVFSCSSEEVIPYSIKYTSESGLFSYATLDQWKTLMNKRNMKDACAKYGIDVIPEYTVEDIENERPISYPVIVKPEDNSGSNGITVCNNLSELKSAVINAREKAKCGGVVIEKYITSPFWQMEIHVQDGIPYVAYTKERVFYPSNDGKAKQPFFDIYPSRYDDRIRHNVFPKFSKLVTDLGIMNASVWAQGFITASCEYIFDVGFRLGGGMENRVTAMEKGIDNINGHISFALTGKWIGDYSECKSPYDSSYITVCVGLKNGAIEKIEGVDRLRCNPHVFDIIQYYEEGDHVTQSGLYRQSLLRVYIKDFQENPKELISEIYNQLRVTDCEGNNMLLPVNNLDWDNELPLD